MRSSPTSTSLSHLLALLLFLFFFMDEPVPPEPLVTKQSSPSSQTSNRLERRKSEFGSKVTSTNGMYVCMHVCMYVCMSACLSACLSVCVCLIVCMNV